MPTAMSTFNSDKQGLQGLLDDIHDGKIQLPDFQRDWRWDDDHIRSLLASVSLSYPIGAILLMETGGADGRFAPRPLAGVKPDHAASPQRLILDGQQRLTALYQVLKSGQVVTTRDIRGNQIRRWYYLDIEQALDPNAEREDAIISIPEDRKVTFRGRVIQDYSDKSKECEAGLFPLEIVFDIARLFQWLDSYTNPPDPAMAVKRKELRDKLVDQVVSRFQQYQVPVIELRRETPKEAVCLVFEKVNTGGVSLTVFELVTASFAADGYQLRKDWADRERQIKRLPPLDSMSNSDFLTAVTLLSTWERHQQDGQAPVSCKRRDILRLSLKDYLSAADRITATLEDTARFLHRQKIFKSRDMPYQTQLIPLVAILTALGEQAEHDAVKQMLARWFWCGVLGELYGSAIESRFARDLPEVVTWVQGGPEPGTIRDSNFAPQRLLSLRTRNSAAYKGIHALLMREGCQDFRTGDSTDLQTYFDDGIDIHHIFPRRACENLGIPSKIYNSAINKTPLAARTNRIIGGDLPSVYLERLQHNGNISHQRMDDILRSHLVEPNLLRSDNFESFFRERQNALLTLIEHAMGKPIPRADLLSEVEEAEEEDETEFDLVGE